jgi:hypothetical protein
VKAARFPKKHFFRRQAGGVLVGRVGLAMLEQRRVELQEWLSEWSRLRNGFLDDFSVQEELEQEEQEDRMRQQLQHRPTPREAEWLRKIRAMRREHEAKEKEKMEHEGKQEKECDGREAASLAMKECDGREAAWRVELQECDEKIQIMRREAKVKESMEHEGKQEEECDGREAEAASLALLEQRRADLQKWLSELSQLRNQMLSELKGVSAEQILQGTEPQQLRWNRFWEGLSTARGFSVYSVYDSDMSTFANETSGRGGGSGDSVDPKRDFVVSLHKFLGFGVSGSKANKRTDLLMRWRLRKRWLRQQHQAYIQMQAREKQEKREMLETAIATESEESEELEDLPESDSDDEGGGWTEEIFIEMRAAEQQKTADERGLNVEVLRASAQKQSAATAPASGDGFAPAAGGSQAEA